MARRGRSTQPNVGAWLGGNKGYLQSGSNTDTSAKVDSGGGQAEAVRGQLGLGAYTAGIGATAAIGAGVAAARSGVAARAVNKVTGQKVVVHASPKTGLRQIEPRLGSNQLPQQNVVFGWDPRKTGAQQQITRSAGKYVSKESNQPAGSVYVAKFKKSDIVTPPKLISSGQIVSKSSAKVVQEIPVAGKTFAQVDAELQRQLRRAGAAAKPDVSRGAAVVGKATTKIRQTFMTQAQKDAARRKRIR